MFATSGNAQIAYDVAGDGASGTDVVLFHAGVTDRRSWRQVVERLSPRHRCVAFDARQFGETTYERDDGWSNVDDAMAVMNAVGVTRPVLVAGSMGGATAIDLALAHPERVGGLVLIGPAVHGAPYPDITEEPTATLVARAEKAEESEDFEVLNRLEAWLWLDGPTAPEGRVSGDAARPLPRDERPRAAGRPPGRLPPAIPMHGRASKRSRRRRSSSSASSTSPT